jgi:hypothetical protein
VGASHDGPFHVRAWVRSPLPPYRNAVPKCWSRNHCHVGSVIPVARSRLLPPQATYRLHLARNGPHKRLYVAGTELRFARLASARFGLLDPAAIDKRVGSNDHEHRQRACR